MRRTITCLLVANSALALTACLPFGVANTGVVSSRDTGAPVPLPRERPPAPHAGQTPLSRFPLLRPGDRGAQVQEVHRRLDRLGFGPGEARDEYRPALRAAVWAFQKANGLPPADQIDPQTWRALSRPARLKPLVSYGEPTRVEIDLRRQLLTAWKDGRPELVSHISTGNGEHYCKKGHCGVAVTPTGDFRAWFRTPGWTSGPLGDQFYTIYFNEGIGFHGSERVPRHPASHGCIRVPLHNAKALYDMTPTGTPVYVRRPEAPGPPARATSPDRGRSPERPRSSGRPAAPEAPVPPESRKSPESPGLPGQDADRPKTL
ncbi:L,D-transpeptidase family protein [Streptosporangium sp. V21-05]|uniref:L,D-transpeptidase family protein n=1 Tax=Streptosporangium sp. V21-05 TaxID=3446115 RepID=UPI003F53136F